MKTGAVGWGKISVKFLSDTGLPSEIIRKTLFNDKENNQPKHKIAARRPELTTCKTIVHRWS